MHILFMFISFTQRVINRVPLETTQITGYPWQSHLGPGTGLAAGLDSREGGRTLVLPRAGLEGGWQVWRGDELWVVSTQPDMI